MGWSCRAQGKKGGRSTGIELVSLEGFSCTGAVGKIVAMVALRAQVSYWSCRRVVLRAPGVSQGGDLGKSGVESPKFGRFTYRMS